MSSDTPSRIGPAYIALPTLKTFLTQQKEHGVPPQIDRSVLDSFANGTQSHLMASLKFLNLINADNVPTPLMRPLVDAVGTDLWPEAFAKVLRPAYKEVLGETEAAVSTPQMIEAKMRAAGVDGSTLDKGMRFFIHAFKDAKIPLSPHLTKKRTPGGKRQSRKTDQPPPADQDVRRQRQDVDRVDINKDEDDAEMKLFPIHLRGKKSGKVYVPGDITVEDCKMLKAVFTQIEIYAAANAD